MSSAWGIYIAGFMTPVAMALAVYFLIWLFAMFEPAGIFQNKCEICEDAGYKWLAQKGYTKETNSWHLGWIRFKHRIVARLPKHRDSWEKYFAARPFYSGLYEKNRHKYGRPDMKESNVSHEE